MVVAWHVPHNEGLEYGVFTEPSRSTGLSLVDLYEVDGQIQTFETLEEAQKWLSSEHGKALPPVGEMEPNRLYHVDYPDEPFE